MNTMTVNGEKWIVSLSDGRTIMEDDLCDEPQRISPWGKLEEILAADDGVHITQLRVQVGGRTYTSLSSSDRSKFHSRQKPVHYMCLRRMGVDALNPGQVHMHCIGMQAELDSGMKILQWVDVYTGDSWQQIT